MRIQTILIFFLAIAAPNLKAQCDPKEYNRIFNEASALKEKGVFIDAKNRYEAAKIYACNQKEKDAADRAVDRLFEQIERLRLQTQAARDTAEAEKTKAQQAALTAYGNDLAYKSKISLNNGDRTTAFRLAEIAYRYVENDNYNVTLALIHALYCNNEFSIPSSLWHFNLNEGVLNVNAVDFSSDGKRVAIATIDKIIKIWDIKSGKVTVYLKGHTDEILNVKFSPNGQKLASYSKDKTVKIWELEGRKIPFSIEQDDKVNDLAFFPDNKRLVIGSDAGIFKIWSLENGEILQSNKICTNCGILSIDISLNGKWLAIGSGDNTAKIWDLHSDKLVLNLMHSDDVNSVAFSPDGKWLATGTGNLLAGYGLPDTTARVWDLKSGKVFRVLPGYNRAINSVCFSSDGYWLATADEDGTAKVWDWNSGRPAGLTLSGHTTAINSISFSSDDKWIATVSKDHAAKLWDLESSGQISTLTKDYSGWVNSVAFSPDGKKLGIAQDSTAKIWDLEDDIVVLKLQCTDKVNCVAFSPDGKMFATGSADKTVKIWNLKSGEIKLIIKGQYESIEGIAFSPDGRMLATAAGNDKAKIWDTQSGQEAIILHDLNDYVNTVAFSPDGKKLATGGVGEVAKIWDLQTGKLVQTLSGHTDVIRSVTFSPDGNRLVTGAGGGYPADDFTAKIWDWQTGKLVLTLSGHTDMINNVAFSPDGKILVTGSGGYSFHDSSFRIWDLISGKEILSLTNLINGSINSVAFSPDGKKLATGHPDDASIWDIDPTTIIHNILSKHRLGNLSLLQLKTYNLEDLLDLHPDNEAKLIATQETWQIKAFADLAASQAAGSNILSRVEPHYSRADRLYAAALALEDEELIRIDYAKMLRRWAEVYQSDGLNTKATELTTKADSLYKE